MPAIRLQQDVALPQTRSKLVWGLLSSLRRDTNTNPASSPHGAGEESQTGQLGRAGRSAQPEGEAFAQCSNMLQLAGKRLTTLLVKAAKIQLRINSLKRNLADELLPPGFAPKPIPFGEATEDMKARWRDLDNVFWKQRTELAVVFETENSERANQEVESHLESTTKLLREARCTTLGLKAEARAGEEELQTSSPLNLCTNSVFCNCPLCCRKINLAPLNLGRLIRACKEGAKEYKTSGKFLCNLSDFTLGDETMRLLSKGLTFIPKPVREKKDPPRREVLDFIRKLRLKYTFRNRDQPVPELYRKTGYDPGKTESQMLERFITKLKETLFKVIRQRPLKPRKDNLGPRMRKALDALQRQKQFLVFRKADKGSVIVVENVEDYIRNGREHLADPQVYQRLDRDGRELAQAIKQAVKLRLRRLHNAGRLTEEQYKYCLPLPKVRPGRLYFLKKIHKRPHGIRLIVSSCANATENTSQFVDICLQPMAKKLPSYIRDSTDFLNKIKNLKISPGAILASLDVVSLYTNIPHKEGIASVHKATLESESPRVEAATLAELTKIVLKNNILEFAGENFLQIQGTAMGTKLAPAYANVFMGDVERRWQMQAPQARSSLGIVSLTISSSSGMVLRTN